MARSVSRSLFILFLSSACGLAGRSVSLTSNEAGNFYSSQVLAAPLQVAITRPGSRSVVTSAPGGDCNSCHGSTSRIHVP